MKIVDVKREKGGSIVYSLQKRSDYLKNKRCISPLSPYNRGEKTMIVTCRQLAKLFGIDYLQASSVIKMLIATGVATESDSIKKAGRGRPTIQYVIPSAVNINFNTGEVKDAYQSPRSRSDSRNSKRFS